MKHCQQGTADDLAQGQSGRCRVGPECLYQTVRQLDRERHFRIADRDRTFELLCLLEIAIGLAPGDGAGEGEVLGGLEQALVFPQQGASQVEPLSFLGIAGAGHIPYIYVCL